MGSSRLSAPFGHIAPEGSMNGPAAVLATFSSGNPAASFSSPAYSAPAFFKRSTDKRQQPIRDWRRRASFEHVSGPPEDEKPFRPTIGSLPRNCTRSKLDP